MKNKKLIIILTSLIVLIGGIFLVNNIYQNKNTLNKTKRKRQNNLAIMIKEEGASNYIKLTSKDIPKGNYILNRDKSYCKNNGVIGDYDSTLGKVSFSFVGTDSCFLYFDYDSKPKGYEKILLDNGNGATTVDEAKVYIEGKGIPDFSATATTNEGMYAKEDDYTATTGMKSYYFRGAVNNNWVKFGKENGKDIYWRIIRINGDGSIRMIYSGTTKPDSSTATVMTGEGTQIGMSKFNENMGTTVQVGYMYTSNQQHGTSTPSTIKIYLDNWYEGTTLVSDTIPKKLVTDQIFCNDRSVTSGTWSSSPSELNYSAFTRLYTNKSPQLKCPTASDKFTVNTNNGNGTLSYPVGLITADEISMAGGVLRVGSSDITNSEFYLNTNQNYWTGTPYGFYGKYNYTYMINMSLKSELESDFLNNSYGVRPVISLSSKTKLLGDGTWNNVYRVTTDDTTDDTSSDKSFDTVFAANNTDIFNEKGIRYEGANPNNYICLDNKTSGACSSSSLLFRIIGLFDEDTSTDGTNSSGTKKLLKIIDTNNYGGTSGKYWDSNGKNNWSSASLKTELNGTYLTTLLGTSNVNSKLSSAIANAKWHLGGANNTSSSNYYYQKITTENLHKAERSPYATSGTLQNLYSGNPSSIYAKVGLMYPSDYAYATVGGTTTNKSSCRDQILYNWKNSSYSDCKNNNWLFTSQATSWGSNKNEWLLSPCSWRSYDAAALASSGSVGPGSFAGDGLFAVRPAFYLDSSILKIVGTGDGSSSNPYRIG